MSRNKKKYYHEKIFILWRYPNTIHILTILTLCSVREEPSGSYENYSARRVKNRLIDLYQSR